jgi:hypothetical protein
VAVAALAASAAAAATAAGSGHVSRKASEDSSFPSTPMQVRACSCWLFICPGSHQLR